MNRETAIAHFSFVCDERFIRIACYSIAGIADTIRYFSLEELEEIKSCVEEVFNNSCQHGYLVEKGKIDFWLCEDGEKIIIEAQDYGEGMKSDKTLLLSEEKTGMGFTIIDNCCTFEIESKPQQGTCIRMEFQPFEKQIEKSVERRKGNTNLYRIK